MSSLAIRAKFETIRTIAAGSISASYAPVGIPLVNAIRQYHIYNGTDALLMFSIDGVNDHFVLPASGAIINDLTSNKTQVHGLYFQTGVRLYVKQISAPTTGSVYFTTLYGAEA